MQKPRKAGELDIYNEFEFNDQSDIIDTIEMKSFCHRIFIDDEISDPKYYRKVILTIMNSAENDSIIFLINSIGGDLFSLRSIVETFRMMNVKTTALVMGKCYSAASMLTLSCDKVIVYPSAEMMIHTAQMASGGSCGNWKRSVNFSAKSVEDYLEEVYFGFLSPEEIEKVKNDQELYFDANQIMTRVTKMKRVRSKLEKDTPKQPIDKG